MHRRRRDSAGSLTAVVVLGAVMAPGAAAHVTIQPAASRPAELQRYRVIVPDERSASTTEVDLRLPDGVTFALVEQVAGWRTTVVKRGSAISELRWRGGPVPPDGYAELRFIARNPVRTGPIVWKALQRYDDGTIVRWIGNEDSDSPAPVTTLSEDAVPVDVVSTHGEDAPRSPATPAVATGQAASTGGRDTLTLALAIVGALLGAAALAPQLMRARRDTR
jgi:uncharacterized protein YcnI